jgi:hypothetical protein
MNRFALRHAATAASGLMLACAAMAASAQAPSLGQVFTCTNNAGRMLTSDRLIGECMDREQRVLSRDGTLIRVVPPQLTADERAAKEERDRRAQLERQARVEAVRRDRLLLQRFPNEGEHQKARQSALEDVQASMKLSQQRLAELERERKPLLEESEFYKGKQLPTLLKQQLDANEAAVAAQKDAQVNQQAELERIGKRYDTELAHLKRLWGGAEPGSILVMAESAAAADPKAAKPVKPASTQAR